MPSHEIRKMSCQKCNATFVHLFVRSATSRRQLTLGAEWHECVLLLEVEAAEELTVLNDELIALLQAMTARNAREAGKVVHTPGCSHHQLVRRDELQARAALRPVQSVNKPHNNTFIQGMII